MPLSNYVRALNAKDKTSYFKKLIQLGLREEDDPYLVNELESSELQQQWSSSTESWPEVEFGDVYTFLIDLPRFSKKILKAYKSLSAYNLFVKRCVHQLYVCHSNTGYSIITGCVNRSPDDTDKPHKAWIGFDTEDGSIMCGHCTCMIKSKAICDHVIAMAFHIEAFPRLDDIEKSCSCCPCDDIKQQIDDTSLPAAENIPSSVVDETLKENVMSTAGAEEQKIQSDSYTLRVSVSHNGLENIKENICEDVCSNTWICEDVTDDQLVAKVEESVRIEGVDMKFIDIYVCETCNAAFSDSSSLKSHTEIHHNASNTQIVEDQIGMTSKEKPSPTATHHCEKCDMTFANRRNLRKHLQSLRHNKDRLDQIKDKQNSSVDSQSQREVDESEGRQKSSVDSQSHQERDKSVDREKSSKQSREDRDESKDKQKSSNDSLQSQQGSLTDVDRTAKKNFALSKQTCKDWHLHESLTSSFTASASRRLESQHNSLNLRHHGNNRKPSSINLENCQSENHLKSRNKTQKCHECGKDFLWPSALLRHKKTHSGENRKVHVKTCFKTKKIKPMKCKICTISFHHRSILARHMQLHSRKRPFQCTECGKSFPLNCASAYAAHIRFHAKKKAFQCFKCLKSFKISNHLIRHMKVHDENLSKTLSKSLLRQPRPMKVFECSCGKSFKTRTRLLAHGSVHSDKKPFQCKDCGKNFKRKTSLLRHMILHDINKVCMCDECGKSFTNLYHLKQHLKTHTGEKPNVCKVCSRAFSEMCNLRRHMLVHTGEKPFLCVECGQRFTQNVSLQAHMKRHGNKRRDSRKDNSKEDDSSKDNNSEEDEPQYKCNECDRVFRKQSYLKMHMDWHKGYSRLSLHIKCNECNQELHHKSIINLHELTETGDKVYKCTECGNTFLQLFVFLKHMRTHTTEIIIPNCSYHTEKKLFMCYFCDKGFASAYYRDDHAKLHTGESKSVCPSCGKQCVNKTILKFHMKIHTGEKPFSCNVCGKCFAYSANFSRHKRIHTGERPFPCSVCGKSFQASTVLYTHMRTHTGEKPYKCTLCSQAYADKRALTKHLQKHQDKAAESLNDVDSINS